MFTIPPNAYPRVAHELLPELGSDNGVPLIRQQALVEAASIMIHAAGASHFPTIRRYTRLPDGALGYVVDTEAVAQIPIDTIAFISQQPRVEGPVQKDIVELTEQHEKVYQVFPGETSNLRYLLSREILVPGPVQVNKQIELTEHVGSRVVRTKFGAGRFQGKEVESTGKDDIELIHFGLVLARIAYEHGFEKALSEKGVLPHPKIREAVRAL